MSHQTKRAASFAALLLAALASVATSPGTPPTVQSKWIYSETSEPATYVIDLANPVVGLEVNITTNGALAATTSGEVLVLATVTSASAVETLIVLNGRAAREVVVPAGEQRAVELGESWRPVCDIELGCEGDAMLSIELDSGDAATITIEVTAILYGPSGTADPPGPAPEGSDIEFEVVVQ